MAKLWNKGDLCLIVEGLASLSGPVSIRDGVVLRDQAKNDDYVTVRIMEEGVAKNVEHFHRAYLMPNTEKLKKELTRLSMARNELKRAENNLIGEVYQLVNAISRGEME